MTDLFAVCDDPETVEDISTEIDGDASYAVLPRQITQGAIDGCVSIDLSSEEYHSLPDSVSCTGLKKMLRSGAHMQAYLDSAGTSEGDDLGTSAHCALLEPERFVTDYVAFEGYRRGPEWKQFKTENDGKIILNRDEYAKVQGMVGAVHGFKEYPIAQAIAMARREFSVFWTDEETGIVVRVRFDALNDPFAIWDYKTTSDARPSAFVKQAIRLDYDLQSYMYSEAARRFTGKIVPFIFIAIETDAPHGIWLHPAGESMLENGRRKFRKALQAYKQCLTKNEWPGYLNPISTLEFPRYAMISE